MENKHIDRLLAQGHKLKADPLMSLPIARDHGYYPAILHTYLQDQQEEQKTLSPAYNVRNGLRWIPKLTAAEIVNERPVFPDTLTVERAAATLKDAGLILMETTGAFLEPDHVTGRKRDIATWWHIVTKGVPLDYFDRTQRQAFSSLEAATHGIPQALLLALWRRSPKVEGYVKLSAVELEKVLSMDERTARRHLKALVKAGKLIPHPLLAKLYGICE